MNKGLEVMRGILRFAAYLGVALFLVWRAETYIDVHDGGSILPQLMCLSLAILLLMTGVMRALDSERAA